MNENYDENAGSSASRGEGSFARHRNRDGAATMGNRYFKEFPNGRNRKHFDFWTGAEILAHRWHWIVVCGILSAGFFFSLGWFYVQPRFIATVELLRYETPGTSDFLKTSPLTPQTFGELITAPELIRRAAARAEPPIPENQFARRVKVDPQVESDFIKVYVAASTPQEAVQLANIYGAEATNYTSELQASQAGQVADSYLKEEVDQMDKDITELTSQFRGMPAESRASASNQLAQVGSSLNSLNQNPALSPQSAFLVTKLNEQLANANIELSQMLQKYTDEHPSVIAQRQKIEALNKQIAQASGSTNPAVAAVVTEANGSVVQPDVEVIRARLRSLEDARIALASHQREAQLFASNPPGMCRVSAAADLNTTRSGHRRLKIGAITIFGAGLGAGVGFLLVVLIEATDRRLRTADDVRRVTQLPVLTILGELGDMKEHARTQWAFRTWTLLQGRLSYSQNHGMVCGVTSSTEGEGRSTCISMLAEAASLAGFRVLTIATRPSSSHIELPNQFTEETLDHQASMSAVAEMQSDSALTGSVLTAPSQVTDKLTDPNSRPVVHIPLPGWVWNLERRKQWREAINHWRKVENLVILVELPPACVPEAVLLGANLPNLIWLAASGQADAAETRVQLDTLRHAHCNLVGAVLNRAPLRPIKSYFPRWLSSTALFVIFSVCAVHAQTSLTNGPALALQSQTSPPPGANDTNATNAEMPLLTEPPPGNPEASTTESNIQYSFSVVSPLQRAEWERKLTLGPGDVLSISLYGDVLGTRMEMPVGPDGRVSFLEAHDIMANGMTIDALREKLDDALSKYRRAPRTIIVPVAYGSKKYYVLGKVVERGIYILDRPTTVLEALARAKGIESGQVDYDILDVADLKHAFLMRQSKRVPIDFEKLFSGGDLSQNVQIEPGDYLYFPSADVKQVYVLGEVVLPGAVTYRPDLTMLAAISARGGFDEKAFKSRVLVVRGSLSHPQTFVQGMGMSSDTIHDLKLEPNDIIYVSWRPFIRGEELADLAAQAFIQSVVNGWVSASVVKP